MWSDLVSVRAESVQCTPVLVLDGRTPYAGLPKIVAHTHEKIVARVRQSGTQLGDPPGMVKVEQVGDWLNFTFEYPDAATP